MVHTSKVNFDEMAGVWR